MVGVLSEGSVWRVVDVSLTESDVMSRSARGPAVPPRGQEERGRPRHQKDAAGDASAGTAPPTHTRQRLRAFTLRSLPFASRAADGDQIRPADAERQERLSDHERVPQLGEGRPRESIL